MRTGRCMAELTNDWIDAVFDVPDFHYPTLWIAPALLAAAGSRIERLRAAGDNESSPSTSDSGETPASR